MFQSALIESSSKGPRATLRLPLGLAALLHGAAGLIILGTSFWSVGDVPDPPAPLVFEVRLPPPAGGAASRAPAGAASPRRTIHPLVQPVEIPREIPRADESGARSDSLASETNQAGTGDASIGSGGTGEGTSDGVPGGVGGQDGTGDEIIPASSATEIPVLTLRVEPVYPDLARRIHAEGLVVLEAVISASGSSSRPASSGRRIRFWTRRRYGPSSNGATALRGSTGVPCGSRSP